MTHRTDTQAGHKPQVDKFRELARELETDESAEHFDRKLKKIVKAPPDKDEKSKD